jgi:hypothetical protein
MDDVVNDSIEAQKIRHNLISKMTYAGVFSSQSKGTKKSQNLTIFDWDDTFFPTSAFNPRYEDDMRRIGAENTEYFAQLDSLIVKLLKKTLEENSTSILVTNAHRSWVEYSA